jgi:nickel transport protein
MVRLAPLLLALALALPPLPASAHKLKIFATAAGGQIAGRAYFVGGGPARQVTIKVETPAGEQLGAVTTDADGRFAMTMVQPVDHVLIADLADGHVARFVLAADGAAEALGGAPAAPAGAGAAAELQLAARIEQAVARQVQPILIQLNAYQDQLWLRDILGGIGFILGLAGLLAWVKARRPDPPA